ncbi:hypothetical protein M0811_06824 [Anaeramoeba ignava]|uniref:Dephospho-CoA kinase n=1 Tax=Anaeramoeba ignava TaxID=1746090 RepID=A0A9Q0LN47_ANAIG|nr:hypothetical protein M0811_06824 [Anaeramoeba ignava]
MAKIIGLCGLNCSGKTTALKFFESKGYYTFSLSDIIRQELRDGNKQITRENMRVCGNDLRKELGEGCLAKKALELISKKTDFQNFIVDSIRHPEEVKELRKNKAFTLLCVSSPVEERFKRMIQRKRDDDDPITLEKFIEQEKKEFESSDPSAQQNKATMELADQVVENLGSTEDFEEKLKKFL